MSEIKYKRSYDLFDKYLCGDTEAGEQLFSLSYPQVQKFVYEKTKTDTVLNEADKEDIISEAMIRVIQNSHLYNGTCEFTTFIIGYAQNIIKEKRRQQIKQANKIICIDTLDNNMDDIIDIFDNPENIIIQKEKMEIVHKVLEMLCEDHRTIIKLRIFNGMSFKQLVEFTGKSEDSVDSLFRRAIKSFKNQFEKIYNNATDF